MDDASGPAAGHEGGSFASALAFAGASLAVGMLVSGLSFAAGFTPSYVAPRGWAPPWLFLVAWVVIYPSLGLSAWSVWTQRRARDVRAAMAVFALVYVNSGLFFLPIMVTTRGNPLVMTFMDLDGIVGTVVLAWTASRYSRRALAWLWPMMIWMPITFTLKIWLTLANA